MKGFSTILILLIIMIVEISSIYFVSQKNQWANWENTSQNLPYSNSPTTTSVTTSALPYSSCTISSINLTTPKTFTVISPKNTCYNDGRITVSVRANENSNWMGESFDGGSVIKECYNCISFAAYHYLFSLGNHNMTVYVESINSIVETAIINFEVLLPGANITTSSIIASTTSTTNLPTTSTTQTTTITIPTTSTTTTSTSTTTTTPPQCKCSAFVCNNYCGGKSGDFCFFDDNCLITTSTTTTTNYKHNH